jgi:hypothetical protein
MKHNHPSDSDETIPQQTALPKEKKATYNLTHEDLQKLKAAFSKDRLGVKVQCLNREKTRALLVLYLQHTDVQDRLEEVDPSWSTEVLQEQNNGSLHYVRIRLTLKGVPRENVGEGADPKSAYSDALKRSAMLFGVGRYLYDSPTVWSEYDDTRDKFKQWTIQDYEKAYHKQKAQRPQQSGANQKAS